MPVHNADIAAVFDEIADLLEIEGANQFRVRAYRNAARTLGELGRSVQAMVAAGADLTELPGIGTDLAAKIQEIVATGTCSLLGRLHKELPPAITELLKVPGLGPKRVRALHHDLDVQTLEQLQRAAKDGRIREIPGFGPKTEQQILEAIQARVTQAHRFKLVEAAQYAEALLKFLAACSGVSQAIAAGSFRRMRETVGDLDILVTARTDSPVMQRFVEYEEVKEVLASGPTRASVVLKSGLQVDLRVVAPESFGAALVYFTGSKAHNIALRRLAQERGLKINEYGVFRGQERIAGETEESVYFPPGSRFSIINHTAKPAMPPRESWSDLRISAVVLSPGSLQRRSSSSSEYRPFAHSYHFRSGSATGVYTPRTRPSLSHNSVGTRHSSSFDRHASSMRTRIIVCALGPRYALHCTSRAPCDPSDA